MLLLGVRLHDDVCVEAKGCGARAEQSRKPGTRSSFDPIVLEDLEEGEVSIIAELLEVLR